MCDLHGLVQLSCAQFGRAFVGTLRKLSPGNHLVHFLFDAHRSELLLEHPQFERQVGNNPGDRTQHDKKNSPLHRWFETKATKLQRSSSTRSGFFSPTNPKQWSTHSENDFPFNLSPHSTSHGQCTAQLHLGVESAMYASHPICRMPIWYKTETLWTRSQCHSLGRCARAVSHVGGNVSYSGLLPCEARVR